MQCTCGVGQSNAYTERRYDPDKLRAADDADDDDDDDELHHLACLYLSIVSIIIGLPVWCCM